MEKFQFHQWTFTWLQGGNNHLDGGAMFGVVPKALWTRHYPESENNTIELRTDPILIEGAGELLLIEAGIGRGKLTEKQKRNLGVTEESDVKASLATLGYTTEDVRHVLMTHMHNDHAGGLTAYDEEGKLYSVFPNAHIYVSAIEWEEMKNPNIRSRNAYFEENWRPIEHQVVTYEETLEVVPNITLHRTGGHSAGHSIVKVQYGKEQLLHMGDLFGTHAHLPSLWVMAYDDYPMDSIVQKENIMKDAIEQSTYFTFYHDAYYRVIQYENDGKAIRYALQRKSKQ